MKDAADKLVHILVGLESIILKDSNEPIMNNIGERMAALIGHDPASRKAIIGNVKKTYALRSSFIHHGQRISVDEADTLREFMFRAWTCLDALVRLAYQNPTMTKAQYFDWIEERRLSY
jgi:Apea-like HEPN